MHVVFSASTAFFFCKLFAKGVLCVFYKIVDVIGHDQK